MKEKIIYHSYLALEHCFDFFRLNNELTEELRLREHTNNTPRFVLATHASKQSEKVKRSK